MWVLVCLAHLWIRLFYIPFKGKKRPSKTKLVQAKLCTVLVTFGFSENLIVDSAQCQPARNLTPHIFFDFRKIFENILKIRHMDPRFPRNFYFRKSKKFVRLRRVRHRAVIANFGFVNISIFDSAQCQPAQSLTVRKRTFKQNHFSLFIRGQDEFDS